MLHVPVVFRDLAGALHRAFPGHTDVDLLCSLGVEIRILLFSTNLKCSVMCVCVFLTSNKLTPTDLCLVSVCSVHFLILWGATLRGL